MIRKNQRFLELASILVDGLIVITSYLLASWVRIDFLGGQQNNIAVVRSSSQPVFWVACIYAASLVFVLALLRYYNPSRLRRLRHDFLKVLEANLLCTLGVGTALYAYRLEDFSRGVLVAFFIVSTVLLWAKRLGQHYLLAYIRTKGYNRKHILVVGTGVLAQQYARDIAREQSLGFHIKGFIGSAATEKTQPLLGGIDDLDAYLTENHVDEVVVALEACDISWVNTIIRVCEKNGAKIGIVPFYNNLMPSCPSIEVIGRSKIINLRSNPLDNLGFSAFKRFCDIVASILLILLLSPLMIVIVLGIKLTSPGPIFFMQDRVGRGKVLFKMYKFRSMRVNSSRDTAWTTNEDRRKTAFGSFLRKFSLDELPQLFNVLRGEMSLVGPRPEIPYFVEQFRNTIPLYMVKHQVRPGMTGWAQVNGYRGDTSIEKRTEYDIWYIEHWSLGLDMSILLRTFWGGFMNREKLATAKKGEE